MDYQPYIGDLKMIAAYSVPKGWEQTSCDALSAAYVAANLRAVEMKDRSWVKCLIYVGSRPGAN